MSKLGTFIWHDLMTTDLATSRHFYGQLFGWNAPVHEGGGMTYAEITTAKGRPQGGMMPLPSNQGIPSHWYGYVLVDDVDKAVARAAEMGGKVHMPPQSVPNVGRFAILQDPTGGVFAPFKYDPQGEKPMDETPHAGRFCWDELMTDNPEAAAKFYSALFNWTWDKMDMGGGMTYWIAKLGDQRVCGMMKREPEVPVTFWLAYVLVDNVDASAKQARELGATQFVPPTDIPNVGRFAVFRDKTGAAFALFKNL